MIARDIDEYDKTPVHMPGRNEAIFPIAGDEAWSIEEKIIVRKRELDTAHDIGVAMIHAEIAFPGTQEVSGQINRSKY
jgi:hypothetical protein